MTEKIEVGDTVYIAYPTNCCGDDKFLGIVFVVGRFQEKITRCENCGCHQQMLKAYAAAGIAAPVIYLKKIPPLSELEEQSTTEKVSA